MGGHGSTPVGRGPGLAPGREAKMSTKTQGGSVGNLQFQSDRALSLPRQPGRCWAATACRL